MAMAAELSRCHSSAHHEVDHSLSSDVLLIIAVHVQGMLQNCLLCLYTQPSDTYALPKS